MRSTRLFETAFLTGIFLMFLILAPISTMRTQGSSSILFPSYATAGAFANYTGSGGFIAFLSGVSGNITYFVSSVSPNGTMEINVKGNLSLGTEVGIPTSQVSETLADFVFHPKILPAVPPENLTATKIIFQNITCSFEKNSAVSVPAGTFNATEFQGIGANGSVLDFWFDRSSGLAIQMAGSAAEFQLLNSNIAVPIGFESTSSVGAQIIIVFIVGWTGAGLLFYSVRRYYLKKSRFRGMEDYPKETDNSPSAKSKKSRSQSRGN